MMKPSPLDKNGFTLVELMVAIVIFAIGIVGVAKLQLAAVVSNSFSLQVSEAMSVAQDRAEQLKNLALTSTTMDIGTHASNTVTSAQGKAYNVNWTVAAIAGATARDVNITVTWNEKGIQHSTSLNMIKGW